MTSVSSDRARAVNTSAAFKIPCLVATTANLAALSGLLTIDGVVLEEGDRVLVKDQTDEVDNGIYIADTGDWNRAPDFDGDYNVVQGTLVYVLSGTTNIAKIFRQNTADPTPGETDMTFDQLPVALTGVSAYMTTVLAAVDAAAARALLVTLSTTQIQLGSSTYAVATGTADAILAAFTPTITALTDGLRVRVRCTAGANTTTTPTLKIDALTAKTIVKLNNTALVAGDLPGAGFVAEFTYKSNTDNFELLNPASTVTDLDGGTY